MDKQKLVTELFFRIAVLTLIGIGIVTPLSYRIYFLIIAGFLSGTYCGWFNDDIWEKKEKTLSIKPKYRVHQLWIHIICGIVGSIALHLLLYRMGYFYGWVKRMNGADLILLIISLLGYAGLLPMTLWFFAKKGDIKGP